MSPLLPGNIKTSHSLALYHLRWPTPTATLSVEARLSTRTRATVATVLQSAKVRKAPSTHLNSNQCRLNLVVILLLLLKMVVNYFPSWIINSSSNNKGPHSKPNCILTHLSTLLNATRTKNLHSLSLKSSWIEMQLPFLILYILQKALVSIKIK